MPKARERFAEFLDQDSLDRFGMLYLTTSVGLGYGRQRASRRSFSRPTEHTGYRPAKGAHHHASPYHSPGFAWGKGRTLDHGKPPPQPAARPRHSMRSPTGRPPHASDTSPPFPKERGSAPQAASKTAFGLPVRCRYGNIDPFIHSTTPVGLALGPDSPRDDERGPGTLGHPAREIRTPVSLLMSAFSLPGSPPQDSSAASPRPGTLSYQTSKQIDASASSVACLSPATLSARNH